MGNLLGCFGYSVEESSPECILPSSPGTSVRNTSSKAFSQSSSSGTSVFSSFGGSDQSGALIDPNGEILEKPNLRIFSFAELKNATKNFKLDTVLGEGGFGKVFRGWIDEKLVSSSRNSSSKIVVAIKKLNSESLQGFEEWQSEVNFLGRLAHPNLVKLLGYCWEDKELLLVYEYMPKGSLENHLFRRSPIEQLSWGRRMRMALGAAQGLAFLHASDKQVIYRDFKASNILLDVSYNAKISDFGLAKLGPSGGNSHVTTRVMGTRGYVAPEYIATGHLYIKSDVYGFGVVLLELLTGLRAVDMNRPKGQQNLVEWTKPYLSNKRRLRTIMDPRMEGQYSLKTAFEVAKLTLKCLLPEPNTRPAMKEVVEVLQKTAGMEKVEESKNGSTKAHSVNKQTSCGDKM